MGIFDQMRLMFKGRPFVDHTEEARELFLSIARKFDLEILPDDAPVELSMTIPRQSGLDYKIWLCLQNMDELWLGVGNITFSTVPFEEVCSTFQEALESFLRGENRVIVFKHPRSGRVVKAFLQKPKDGSWVTIYANYETFVWPWLRLKMEIV